MKALASPSKFHGAVEASFKGERKRRLWRIDILKGEYYLLILSEDIPGLEMLSDQFGFAGEYETKDYTSLLNRITNGSKWRFRIAANPTKSVPKENARGKVQAHVTEQYQKEWLINKSERCGFSVDKNDFEVVQSKWYKFYKMDSKRPVSIISAVFEGILTVTDEELFKKSMCEGIGREKAYGMGLLTVMSI